ncbi:hypothetical protein EVAR_38302_1 [Eumeta japonica]|uniref:Uncharacterized protein n=1 Tax=Eumeta variegata TaxID=151549 RepID=A0A4C1W8G0_EUMVA|nr:hypothetical protein EVAR_38302_1 [Eumeta japonica]
MFRTFLESNLRIDREIENYCPPPDGQVSRKRFRKRNSVHRQARTELLSVHNATLTEKIAGQKKEEGTSPLTTFFRISSSIRFSTQVISAVDAHQQVHTQQHLRAQHDALVKSLSIALSFSCNVMNERNSPIERLLFPGIMLGPLVPN